MWSPELAPAGRSFFTNRGPAGVVIAPVVGETHLLIGVGLAACEQGRRVRYSTTAQLVNELAEAADQRQLSRVVGRYGRLDLLLLDELGYVQLDPRGAELLFQIITEQKNEPPSPSARTCRSANGEPCSPTLASSLPSSTASPSTPTSSKPAPSPTGSPPARPAIASEPASFGRRPLTAHKRGTGLACGLGAGRLWPPRAGPTATEALTGLILGQ